MGLNSNKTSKVFFVLILPKINQSTYTYGDIADVRNCPFVFVFLIVSCGKVRAPFTYQCWGLPHEPWLL